MKAWLLEQIEQYGYGSIFLFMLLENIFPPIPSEVILTVGGMLTKVSTLHIGIVILVATAGSLAGAVLLYRIGMLVSKEHFLRWIAKYGKYVRLTQNDMERAFAAFHKYGYWAIFIGRLLPLIRSLISLPAGMTRMPFLKFIVFTTIGTLLWNSVLISLGALFGIHWERILHMMETYSLFLYGMMLLLAVWWVIKRFKKKA
ncbi:putative alkaline phosphatase [Fictibacillus macauensis ZFHKF-1]|uniref:Putative alkaline phosphatase n=1 Tax=Fictibacillus macauensis ZFHKF-1 TaxID=1196324 RepID=I8AMZ7_9BACL|nr:DedA family protein [Fictibacillus macauensis]EIT87084.1 putative alkaline phosphatase [Fictibacillus macauensis ZFHKF-1]